VECIRVSSTSFYKPPKVTEFREITQTTRPLRSSRSFKITSFGTNRKPTCNFLLVINTNLPPILRPFQVVADYWLLSTWECLTLTPPLLVIPCEYPINFTSPETRGIVLPDAENPTIVSSFVWTNIGTCRTDGIPLASTALLIASNADAL